MTNIKCKKCGDDVDTTNGADSNRCKNCDYSTEKSVNTSIEIAKLEDKFLHNARVAASKKITKLENIAKKKIAENTKAINRNLLEIHSNASAQINAIPNNASAETIDAVGKAVLENAAQEREAACEAGLKASELIIKEHTDKVNEIAKSVGLAPPPIALKVQKITHNDLVAIRRAGIDKLKDFLNLGLFFLIAPLGMVILEDYFLVGLMLMLSGFLAFPPLSKKLVSSVDWLSAGNLSSITYVVMVASMFRLVMLVS